MTDTFIPSDAPEARATGAASPQPNLPELKRLNMWVQEQDRIEPGARIWHQGAWVSLREETPMCQTAYCVAGMAVVRAGHTLSARDGVLWDHLFLDGQEVSEESIGDLGAELLGLDHETAGFLFYGKNSASAVGSIIRAIFDQAGADYDSVEPSPDVEIEIKAAEAVRPQLLPSLTNA